MPPVSACADNIPRTWIYSDLPASLKKRLKGGHMTTSKAREQLSQVIAHLHLPEDSFSIRASHLVSKDGSVSFPVRKIVVIIPAHGTVMAVMRRG